MDSKQSDQTISGSILSLAYVARKSNQNIDLLCVELWFSMRVSFMQPNAAFVEL